MLGIVGVIDGCHIEIKAPSEELVAYVNRKGVHSILLQGIIFLHYSSFCLESAVHANTGRKDIANLP